MDTGKSFDLERHPGFARLVLNPNLNAYHWADIERSAAEILTALESAKATAVIVDLSPLDYLGSAQLTLLVRVWKAIKAGGGRMVVLVTAPVVREVLNTAGLSNLWEFSDSLATAYQTLGLQKDGRSRMDGLWPGVGFLALAGAVAGLAASLLKIGNLDPRVSLIVQLAFSGAALAVGIWMIVGAAGMRRKMGVGMVAAAVLLMIVGVLNAVPGGPAPQATKSEETASDKKAEAQPGGGEKAGAGNPETDEGAVNKTGTDTGARNEDDSK